jgi:hypothetical protein
MATSAYPKVYGVWTNMYGVEKTTVTYHLASTYAKLFPDKIVVAIDMCPQANLSSALLTNASGKAHCGLHTRHCCSCISLLPCARRVLKPLHRPCAFRAAHSAHCLVQCQVLTLPKQSAWLVYKL